MIWRPPIDEFVRAGVGMVAFMMTGIACSGGGRLGNAPIVLTEVPNQPRGAEVIALGAHRSGCRVTPESKGMRISCPEGNVDVATFAGPPTLAVRCIDKRLDLTQCTALVRKILLASETK